MQITKNNNYLATDLRSKTAINLTFLVVIFLVGVASALSQINGYSFVRFVNNDITCCHVNTKFKISFLNHDLLSKNIVYLLVLILCGNHPISHEKLSSEVFARPIFSTPLRKREVHWK